MNLFIELVQVRRVRGVQVTSSRAETKQATRSRIVAAAGELFQVNGFAGTSIRMIADAAGVSVGTVMSVGDKNGLLVRVFDGLIEAGHAGRASVAVGSDDVLTRVASGPDGCVTRLVALARPFVELFTRHDDLARVYASILVSGGHESSMFADLATRLTEEFRAAITEHGCVQQDEASAKAGALYFTYVGLLFTASARRTADAEALTLNLRDAFAAICTCRE